MVLSKWSRHLNTLSLLVLILLACISPTATSSHTPSSVAQLPNTIRNFTPQQIIGYYRLEANKYPNDAANCPGKLYISRAGVSKTRHETYYVIEHKHIFIQPRGGHKANKACESRQTKGQVKRSATLAQPARQYLSSRYPKPPRRLTDLFLRAQEEFLIAAEVGDRVCGSHRISTHTPSLWVAPNRDLLDKTTHVAFRAGRKYIIYTSSNLICQYVASAKEQGVFHPPSTRPPPTPSRRPRPSPSRRPKHPKPIPGPVVFPAQKPTALPTRRPPRRKPKSSPRPHRKPKPSPRPRRKPSPSPSPTPSPSPSPSPTPRKKSKYYGLPHSDLVVEELADPACFPAKATVLVRNKGVIPMEDLRIGDEVLVGPQGLFSPVILFTHADPTARSRFVQITAASNTTIRLSPSHFLYLNDALRPASAARPQDSLTLATGKTTKITAVSSVCATGLFNPQTACGDIVVNGVLASTYTTAVRPELAHMLLAPVRWGSELLGGQVWRRLVEDLDFETYRTARRVLRTVTGALIS